jgi:hypothetical protein
MLDQVASKAPSRVNQLCEKWRVPKEVGQDIVKLGLYDIVIYVGECLFVLGRQNHRYPPRFTQ